MKGEFETRATNAAARIIKASEDLLWIRSVASENRNRKFSGRFIVTYRDGKIVANERDGDFNRDPGKGESLIERLRRGA